MSPSGSLIVFSQALRLCCAVALLNYYYFQAEIKDRVL